MSTELAVLRIAPNASRFALPIEIACIKYGIISPIQKAHFLAQVAHESTGFTRLEENLNYSASRLAVVFARHVHGLNPHNYAHSPEKLANLVYANRLGNGNEKSGDGYRFRGRGLIQCTGRSNYTAYSLSCYGDTSLLRDPDRLLDPHTAADNAGWFWRRNDINSLVDEDDILNLLADNDDIVSVTRRVNGGINGLEDRKHWLRLAKEALQVAAYH